MPSEERRSFNIESLHVEDTSLSPYRLTYNRYTLVDQVKPSDYLCFILHGVGHYKEVWEPVLEELVKVQQLQSDASGERIGVAIGVDCIDHGDSAAVNEKILYEKRPFISTEDFAMSFVNVVKKNHMREFSKHRYIILGHSAGTISGILLASILSRQLGHDASAVILLDPPMIRSAAPDKIEVERGQGFVKATLAKRDRWSSREDAFKYLSTRRPWKTWDQRAIRNFVEYGLRPLPTVWYPLEKDGVTLKCTREVESAAYARKELEFDTVELLSQLSTKTPIHAFFGDLSFIHPRDPEKAKYDRNRRLVETITILPGIGHTLPQERPDLLARLVADRLNSMGTPQNLASAKL